MKTFIALCFLNISFIAHSQNSDFDKSIEKMLKMQGTEQNWETTMRYLIDKERVANPEIEAEFWNRFENKLINESYSEFINMLVPIYKKYLTQEDINSIVDFYETNAGKSLLYKMPLILKETMESGSLLGEIIAARIVNEIQSEKNSNYLLDNKGCSKFKTGNFEIMLPDSTLLSIKRDDKFQYEYYNNTTTKYKIIWLNDCRYTLTLLKTDNELMKSSEGKKLITNIYEIGECYYKFISALEGEDFKLDGIMYKIE